MAAIALALVAAASYGVSNFVGPLLTRELPVVPILVLGQLLAFLVSVVVVVAAGEPVPGGGALLAGLIAGVGNALGVAGYYRAAELAPLSIVAPIASTAAVLPVILGLAMGDPLVASQFAGIVLAVAGVAMASRRESQGARPAAATGRVRLGAAAGFALLAALGFGTFLAGMAPAAEDGVFWAVAVSRASLLVLLVGGAAIIGLEQRVALSAAPKAAIPGALLFVGTVAYSFATQEGLLSVVSVLGSLFPVVTVALALVVLKERLGRIQRVGVAATLVGVVLISAQA